MDYVFSKEEVDRIVKILECQALIINALNTVSLAGNMTKLVGGESDDSQGTDSRARRKDTQKPKKSGTSKKSGKVLPIAGWAQPAASR